MKSVSAKTVYKFQVCDKCLDYNYVLLLDCNCGRSICYNCLEQELFPELYKIVSQHYYSPLFQENQGHLQKVECASCLSKTKLCWYCQKPTNDQDKKCSFSDCPMRFHDQCLRSLEGLRRWQSTCPIHSCNLCQKNINLLAGVRAFTCYNCLFSYHEDCLEGRPATKLGMVELDEIGDYRLNPCVCVNCVKSLGLTAMSKPNRRQSFIELRKQRLQPMFTNTILLNYQNFKQTSPLKLLLGNTDLIEQVQKLQKQQVLQLLPDLSNALMDLLLDSRVAAKYSLLQNFFTSRRVLYDSYENFQKALAVILTNFCSAVVEFPSIPQDQLNQNLGDALMKIRKQISLPKASSSSGFLASLFGKKPVAVVSQEDINVLQQQLEQMKEAFAKKQVCEIQDATIKTGFSGIAEIVCLQLQ